MSRYGDGLETSVLQGIFEYGTSVRRTPLIIDTREPLVTRFRKGFENRNIPVPPPAVAKSIPLLPPALGESEYDDISVLTANTTQGHKPAAATKLKPAPPTPIKEFDNNTLVTVVQENQVYYKNPNSNVVFQLVPVGYYDDITNTVEFEGGKLISSWRES